jgi:hypothetical protein
MERFPALKLGDLVEGIKAEIFCDYLRSDFVEQVRAQLSDYPGLSKGGAS